MNITKQSRKDAAWVDENGVSVPVNRLKKSELKRESWLHDIAKEAAAINQKLADLKEWIRGAVTEITELVITEIDGVHKPTKGGITLYNFNGSIKLEVQVNDRIEFESILLGQCKAKLDELFTKGISADEDFIKEIVMDAFETSRGKADTKKILGLKKYASRVKNKLYHEAMALLDKSIRRPDSKTYYRVWVKDGNGQYQNIDLNFSSL